MDLPRLCRPLLLAGLLPLLCGCGAGIVGIVAGTSGGGSSSSRVPAVRVFEDPFFPLSPAAAGGRILIVSNLQIPSTAELQVTLEALGQVDQQRLPTLVEVDPSTNSSTVAFGISIANIVEAVGDLTLADVHAQLRVLVDGRQVGQTLPFLLVRQRVATVEPPPPPGMPLTISAAGNSPLRFRVTGRSGERSLEGVQIEVGVQGRGLVLATGVTVKRIPGSDDWAVSGFAPASAQPYAAFPRIIDAFAGITAVVPDVYFGPAIQGISPAFGSTDGGTLVTLVGAGLVPLSDPEDLNSAPEFSRVSIEIERGGRRLPVPAAQLRQAQSSLNRLVFTVPPTPDGRPGPAQVSVTVDLREVKVSDTLPDAFTYRRPAPGFGPRGALLTGAPIAVEPGTLQGGPGEGLDLALLNSTGGLPRTEVLVAEQNGMFSSFGPPIVSGQQTNPGQRDPVDLCTGDFDGDGDTDVVVINKGNGGATHSWLERKAAPEPLLALSAVGIADAQGDDTRCVIGDFDGDAADDLVLLPVGASTAGPRLVLSRPAGGVPAFAIRPLYGLLASQGTVDAATSADLDGDGALDLVCFTGGTAMHLVVAYGDGKGSFVDQRSLAVTINGYTPDPASPAVGVHEVETGGQLPLALVLAGIELSPVTPPAVAVLRPLPGQRRYQQPLDSEIVLLPGAKAIVRSAFGDLVSEPFSELVLAGAPGSDPEMRLFFWDEKNNGPYGEIRGAFQPGLEPLEQIRSLSIGLAVPADGQRIPKPINAVFVDHRHDTSSGPEDRISTWLVAADAMGNPILVPPDASVVGHVPIDGLALGNFSNQVIDPGRPDREARDCCIATPTGLAIFANGGVGDFAATGGILPIAVVPATLTALDTGGERANTVAFFTPDGQLGHWDPDVSFATFSQADLRAYASNPSWAVSPTSHVLSQDVDGDGYTDLVVILVLEATTTGPYESVILMLRGKDAPGLAEFPFHLPDPSLPVPTIAYEATSAALGDFALGSVVAPELAVAFPHGPNRVYFYRYVPGTASPTDDYFVWSYAEPGRTGLIAGDEPAQLMARDLDGNLTVDLIVASGGDSKVRVFLNTSAPSPSAPEEVNIAAFFESQGTPSLPPGEPTAMLDGDFDGDGVSDVVVVTVEVKPGKEEDHSVSVYLSSGTGGLNSLRVLSPFRTGNKISLPGGLPGSRGGNVYPGLADVNYDGLPDLVLGWAKNSEDPLNLRVLFGGAR